MAVPGVVTTDKKVKAVGPPNAKLAIVGMAPAAEELINGIPFVGPSGRILNNALSTHKVARSSVFITNICEYQIYSSLFQLPRDFLAQQVERLRRELASVKPNCLLVLGDEPLQLLCGKKGIQKWRGSILPAKVNDIEIKCVVSPHPAAFLRGQWKWEPIFRHIDVPRWIDEGQHPEIRLPKREAIVAPSFNIAMDALRESNDKEYVAVDYEGYDEITCIGVGWDSDYAYCIPLTRGGSASYWTPPEEINIWQAFAKVMQNAKVKKVCQNAAFEWIKSWKYGIFPFPLGLDTMHMHHCLYPDFGGVGDPLQRRKRDTDSPGHGLAFINSMYTRTPFYKDDGRKWTPDMGDDVFWRYNATDVMVTYECAMKMREELHEEGLWETYVQNYLGPFYHSLRMEWAGILIDTKRRDDARNQSLARISEIKAQLFDILGYHINVNSPKQMQNLLYQQKGYQVRRNRKTGKPTVDKHALEYFAQKKGDNALNLILEERRLKDFISDICNQELVDGRMHTHFNIGGTDGARWSSTASIIDETGTNFQNLPRRGIARSLFLAG